METADKSRQYMAVCRVVVVVGTVKVCRHNADIISAVLSVQEFAVFKTGYLCKSISFICLFKLTCQQTAFLHRLRSHSRIDTGRAEELQFLAAILPCRVNDIHFKYHIVIHEICKSVLVCDNTAYLCGSKEYIFRLFLCKKSFDSILSAKVKLLVCACNYICVALSFEFTDNSRADHSPVTCYINFCVFLHHSKFSSLVRAPPRTPQGLLALDLGMEQAPCTHNLYIT